MSETVYARDLMSYGATDFDAGGCRARGPTLVAAMAMLTALLLGGCMPATLSPVSDANFTARDKQQLTNPPYQQAWIPPAYQRQVVQYHRKEAPGSILIDTHGRYVYYVLPEGKAIRYGAIVGENGQAWSGVATVGRKEEWPGWTPTEGEKRRLGRFRTMSKAVRTIRWVRARYTFTPAVRTHFIASTARTSQDGSDMRSRRAASGSPMRM